MNFTSASLSSRPLCVRVNLYCVLTHADTQAQATTLRCCKGSVGVMTPSLCPQLPALPAVALAVLDPKVKRLPRAPASSFAAELSPASTAAGSAMFFDGSGVFSSGRGSHVRRSGDWMLSCLVLHAAVAEFRSHPSPTRATVPSCISHLCVCYRTERLSVLPLSKSHVGYVYAFFV